MSHVPKEIPHHQVNCNDTGGSSSSGGGSSALSSNKAISVVAP